MCSPSSSEYYGLKKKEWTQVRCCAVVGDIKDQEDVVSLHQRKAASCASRDYLDAQKAKMSLKARYEGENEKRKKDLENQYKEEFENFDMTQLGIFANYNADKERLVQEYDAKSNDMLTQFTERQSESYTKYMEKIRAETLPLKPRWSPELLSLRKVESLLAKQCEYTQAHMRKSKVAELEKIEHAQWEAVRNKKIKTLEEQFVKKQQDALANVRKKVAAARAEMETKNKRQTERMHFYKDGHERKLISNRRTAMKQAHTEIGRVSFARQLCGTATAAGLRP